MLLFKFCGAYIFNVVIAAFEALRVMLPASSCDVKEAQVAALKLEMRYDAVKAVLGCDGVLWERVDYGPDLRMEVYRWRGDAWPYAVFSGTFYNRVMHGTDMRWLRIGAARNKANIPSERRARPSI